MNINLSYYDSFNFFYLDTVLDFFVQNDFALFLDLGQRKRVIKYLQKLTLKLHYSDCTFYLSLHYLDRVLTTLNKETQHQIEMKLDYVVLAVFLIVAKIHEHDIFKPDPNDLEGYNGERLPSH